jgi:hypothetical protein
MATATVNPVIFNRWRLLDPVWDPGTLQVTPAELNSGTASTPVVASPATSLSQPAGTVIGAVPTLSDAYTSIVGGIAGVNWSSIIGLGAVLLVIALALHYAGGIRGVIGKVKGK